MTRNKKKFVFLDDFWLNHISMDFSYYFALFDIEIQLTQSAYFFSWMISVSSIDDILWQLCNSIQYQMYKYTNANHRNNDSKPNAVEVSGWIVRNLISFARKSNISWILFSSWFPIFYIYHNNQYQYLII